MSARVARLQALDLARAIQPFDAGNDVRNAGRVSLDGNGLPNQPAFMPHAPAFDRRTAAARNARIAYALCRIRKYHVH
jgi:hypothetical protein